MSILPRLVQRSAITSFDLPATGRRTILDVAIPTREGAILMGEVELMITGMTCSSCAQHVQSALEEVPGVRRARVPGWQSGRAFVTADEGLTTDELVAAVHAAGYRAAPVAGEGGLAPV
ncbi:MAG TPA: hypothetical protein DEP84_15675, partial [Chloroflexi bacterium]|nr:hypothetical protein [Chloroflexota bacterium]